MRAIQGNLEGCRTTKDGGWVVSFACGQDQVDQVGEISGLRDEPLFVVVMTEVEYFTHQQSLRTGGKQNG